MNLRKNIFAIVLVIVLFALLSVQCYALPELNSYGEKSSDTIYYSNGDYTITSDNSSKKSFGIFCLEDIVLDSADIQINVGSASDFAYGIYCKNLILKNNSSIKINFLDSSNAYTGIYTTESLSLENNSSISVMTNSACNGDNYGIFAGNDIFIKDSRISAIAGSSDSESIGISCVNDITISGKSVILMQGDYSAGKGNVCFQNYIPKISVKNSLGLSDIISEPYENFSEDYTWILIENCSASPSVSPTDTQNVLPNYTPTSSSNPANENPKTGDNSNTTICLFCIGFSLVLTALFMVKYRLI